MRRQPQFKKGTPFGLLAVLATATVTLLVTPTVAAEPTPFPAAGAEANVPPAEFVLAPPGFIAASGITSFQVGTLTAYGSDTKCVGFLTGVFQNVVVPKDTDCRLEDSIVRGNVKVLQNAGLYALDNEIGGNVQGDKPSWVWMTRNKVGGNIEVVEATGSRVAHTFFACGNTLANGNIAVEKSRGIFIQIQSGGDPPCFPNRLERGNIFVQENVAFNRLDVVDNDVVRGNLQVFKNTGPGNKHVQFNRVGQNLQCFENTPLFFGTPNVAQKREGQCAP